MTYPGQHLPLDLPLYTGNLNRLLSGYHGLLQLTHSVIGKIAGRIWSVAERNDG